MSLVDGLPLWCLLCLEFLAFLLSPSKLLAWMFLTWVNDTPLCPIFSLGVISQLLLPASFSHRSLLNDFHNTPFLLF
jgi:hypothetical protein